MSVLEQITAICRDLNVSTRMAQRMSNHTTLGVGGVVDCIAYPETEQSAAQLVAALDQAAIVWRPLGMGSRLLVSDEPIHHVAVSLKLLEELLTFEGAQVKVHGGYRISRLVMAMAERGLRGLEALAGLPGSIGAAIANNTNGDILINRVESISIATAGKVMKLLNRQLSEAEGKLVLEVVLNLIPAPINIIKHSLARYLRTHAWRERGDINPYFIAGPIFRDINGQKPGTIINRLHLKEFSYGDAALCSWDSNFIVNKGKATAGDVLKLIDLVSAKVWEKHKLRLDLALEVWR
jgi:UDP-N-acetylmuramate dehydrogenase